MKEPKVTSPARLARRYAARRLRRHIAQGASLDPEQPLAIDPFAIARRIGDRIGQAEVDRGEPRVAGIAEPGELDRRGLPRENQHAIGRRMATEIDENVDPVLANARRRLLIRQILDRHEMLAACREPRRKRLAVLDLAARRIGVEEDLDALMHVEEG